MGIFSLFQQKKLFPTWSYRPEGKIWRVMFSASGRIVGECRNDEAKLARFFCLDGTTGIVQWENVSLEEPWWVGIDAVYQDVLFLHEFVQPDMPEHRKIRAVDVQTGAPLWNNEYLTFWFAHRDKVYAYKTLFEKRVAYSLEVRTGKILEEFANGLEELMGLKRVSLEESLARDCVFPEPYDRESVDPQTAHTIQKETRKKRVTGNVEFIRERTMILLNYYSPEENSRGEVLSLTNNFLVVDVARDVTVFSDILNEGAKAPVPDSFFLRGDFVYFIKNQDTLTALRLWKS